MSSSVDQIKSKLDIVTLVSSYVKLEKAGGNFKGRCPFHNEKTPSFFVSPDRGNYYCFGCQAKGDIFTFVQEFEGLDFIGALKVLALKAGVKLEQFEKTQRTEKDNLYSILDLATFFFQKKLSENKEAEAYLLKRGVSEETIKEFRVGFAPKEWRSLHDFLLDRGVKVEDMKAVGLVKQKEGEQVFYDTFRGRVMFPISDSSGRIVGFSGRILVPDQNSPKYLNSPETVLFNKSETLFGLDKAKKDIRLRDYFILVEGQMDLIMLHQIGFKNTVASSGTALTTSHLNRLKRLSNRIIMAYDGDEAGFMAANRSATLALSLGMELKVAEFPKGKDPADLAKENPELLKDSIKNSKHIIDFYTDNLINKGLDGRELGEEVRKNVLPYISVLQSEIEKSHFIKLIAKKTFIKEEAIWDDLKKISSQNEKKDETNYPKTHSPPPVKDRLLSIERKVFGFLMWIKGNKIETEGVKEKEIEKRIKEITGKKFDELKKRFEEERNILLFEMEAYYGNRIDLKSEIEELILALEEEYLKKDFGEANDNLKKAEREKNESNILKYLEECQKISQRINTLKTLRNAYVK